MCIRDRYKRSRQVLINLHRSQLEDSAVNSQKNAQLSTDTSNGKGFNKFTWNLLSGLSYREISKTDPDTSKFKPEDFILEDGEDQNLLKKLNIEEVKPERKAKRMLKNRRVSLPSRNTKDNSVSLQKVKRFPNLRKHQGSVAGRNPPITGTFDTIRKNDAKSKDIVVALTNRVQEIENKEKERALQAIFLVIV
eukprot:TRINITY_DN12022_c0_g4_i1.p1 TRINITY_DN12022_c0_g4~~TRINITY_DN12022_c0_g4_i1.p1  ORF type:complete len:193 (+),score=24.25 TRINITY_DN12022_c0_g4_i1:83-661(+)